MEGRNMPSDKNVPRLLGVAFLFVAIVTLIGGLLLGTAAGSGSISDILVSISNQPTLTYMSVLGQMVGSAGILALAVLLYIVLNKQSKITALVALACWVGEAVFVALSQMGVLALVPLSRDFVGAGAPAHSYYQTLGDFLYYGINLRGGTILMWFYCIGGLMWYYLFFRSKYIPRLITLFGLVVVSVALVGIVLEFLGYDVPIYASLPILPFELAIGGWLMLRGVRNYPETQKLSLDQGLRAFRADSSHLVKGSPLAANDGE
jgi:hypothetical protein